MEVVRKNCWFRVGGDEVERSWIVAEGERMAVLKYMVLLHRDVPRAAQFYSHGLGLAVNVCTKRWAELQSGPCKIALMEAPRFFSQASLSSLPLLVLLRPLLMVPFPL